MTNEDEKFIGQGFTESTRITIPADRWEAFSQWLDAPPRELPRLKRLLQEPGIFDVQEQKPDSGTD